MENHDTTSLSSENRRKPLLETTEPQEIVQTKRITNKVEYPTPSLPTPIRALPLSTAPTLHPLLITILAIPTTIETSIEQQEAVEDKDIRNRDNARIDKCAISYIHENAEEARFALIRRAYRRKNYQVADARRQYAAWRKDQSLGVTWEDVRKYRDRLKAKYREKGEFDFGSREESTQETCQRMWKLDDPVLEVWRTHRREIMGAVPKYVEGFPARDVVKMPRIWTGEFRLSGREACWQCQQKGLPCSLQKHTIGRVRKQPKDVWACSRCLHSGHRDECLVRSDVLPCGYIKAQLQDKISADTPADQTAELNAQVLVLKTAVSSTAHGVKVDFFATHIQNLIPQTRTPVQRPLPRYNRTYWEKKKKRDEEEKFRKDMEERAFEREDREWRERKEERRKREMLREEVWRLEDIWTEVYFMEEEEEDVED